MFVPELEDVFNTSLGNEEPPRGRRVKVSASTLLECVLHCGVLEDLPIEPSDSPPYFRVNRPTLDSDHSMMGVSVRRGQAVIKPTSFDFPVLESDEICVEFAFC